MVLVVFKGCDRISTPQAVRFGLVAFLGSQCITLSSMHACRYAANHNHRCCSCGSISLFIPSRLPGPDVKFVDDLLLVCLQPIGFHSLTSIFSLIHQEQKNREQNSTMCPTRMTWLTWDSGWSILNLFSSVSWVVCAWARVDLAVGAERATRLATQLSHGEVKESLQDYGPIECGGWKLSALGTSVVGYLLIWVSYFPMTAASPHIFFRNPIVSAKG